MLDTEIKVYPAAGGGAFVSYIDPFSKRRIRKQFPNRKTAEAHRDELSQKFEATIKANPADMLVSDLMVAHLKEHPKTELIHSRRFFNDFCDTFGHVKVKDVTTETLHAWLKQVQAEGNYKDATMLGFRIKVNIFFRWLIAKGIIEVSPTEGIQYPKRPEEFNFRKIILTEEAIAKLVIMAKEYSPGFFYPIFLMAVETAAKTSEMMALKWEAIDFKKSTVTFPADTFVQKRTLPLSAELLSCLTKKRHDTDVVFTNLDSKPFGWKKQFTNTLVNFKRHYGIKEKWMFRDIRHSFAVNFLAKGGDIKQLQAILGNRSYHTTEEVYGRYREARRIEVSSPFEG